RRHLSVVCVAIGAPLLSCGPFRGAVGSLAPILNCESPQWPNRAWPSRCSGSPGPPGTRRAPATHGFWSKRPRLRGKVRMPDVRGRGVVGGATRVLSVLMASAVGCFSLGTDAGADELLPPGQGVFTGLTGGSYGEFSKQVGKHPAVNGV